MTAPYMTLSDTMQDSSCALARKPYRIWLLFTLENGDLGAIYVTKRSCVVPIYKVESQIGQIGLHPIV